VQRQMGGSEKSGKDQGTDMAGVLEPMQQGFRRQ